MDEKEIQKLADELAKKNTEATKEIVKAAVTEAFKGAITAEQLTTKLEELGIKGDAIKTLNEAIVKQGEWMRKQEANGTTGKLGWRDSISKGFTNEKNLDKIAAIARGEKGAVNIFGGEEEFVNKAVGTITTANVTTTSGGNALFDLINSDDIEGLNLRDPWIDQYATVTRTSKPVYTYSDFEPGEGDAAFVAEGGLKPQIDLDVVSRQIVPKKVAAYEVMSEEALTDIPQMESMAKMLLLKRVMLKRQNGILFGTGAANTPNGVVNQSGVFAPASWTGEKVTDVNLYDMIIAAANQIYTTYNYTDESAYYPNVAFMNPGDLAALKLRKNEFGMYLFPQFQLVGSKGQSVTVDGITIIPQRDILAGYLLMGDFTKLRIINYIDYNVKVGHINDQLIYNLLTMVGESRFFTVIKNRDKKAFIYDTFANIRAGIVAV